MDRYSSFFPSSLPYEMVGIARCQCPTICLLLLMNATIFFLNATMLNNKSSVVCDFSSPAIGSKPFGYLLYFCTEHFGFSRNTSWSYMKVDRKLVASLLQDKRNNKNQLNPTCNILVALLHQLLL